MNQLNLSIKEILTTQELEIVFPVVKELRSHLDFSRFVELVKESKTKNGYRIFAQFDGSVCVGAIGVRMLTDLVHGRHLYIDDLVVSEKARSKGYGAKLLKFAEELASEYQCEGLRLCTGIENEKGKKFYERQGWNPRAVAYKKKMGMDNE